MSIAHWLKKTTWLLVLSLGAALAHAEQPPIQDFTRWPAISDVAISPSGKRLAMLIFGTNGMRRLGVMDLDPVGQARVVAGFGDADITSVLWVNDDRLVYEAFRRGSEIRSGGAGTFAVNHDGGNDRQLISWQNAVGDIPGTRIASRVLPYGWFFHSTIDDGGNDVFVYKQIYDSIGDAKQIQLARLNTLTRELHTLSFGTPENVRAVLLDPSDEPRVLRAYHGGRTKVYWRKGSDNTWDEVADFDPLKEGFRPWHVDAGGQILVTATKDDTEGLYKFDPVAKKLDSEALVKVRGFDLHPQTEIDSKTKRLMGVHFQADRPVSYWFDQEMQKLQASLDAALPAGRSNRLYCGRCESSQFFVIRSTSDQQPGEYFLFDRKKLSLQLIGAARPWIVEANQGRRSFHRYEARDGLKIPLFVTHPPGAAVDKPLPAVVLVHGGPWVRGSDLTWEAEAQFLASRGYRVLQPEYRGSTGFGFRHYEAGWKQWGFAMQDDLADAVQWSVKQKLVDPSRVCIMGASYGGYAALMGPIAHPGVYRCAVSYAGVTDPMLTYSVTWSDASADTLAYSLPVLMGDPVKDAVRLEAASPLKRVAEIKIPVLLAHGGADRRVPIVHARKFAEAAQKAGVSVERVEYLDEGHGFFDEANHANFYERVEKFLKASLQPAD